VVQGYLAAKFNKRRPATGPANLINEEIPGALIKNSKPLQAWDFD